MNTLIYKSLPTRVIFGRGNIFEAASKAKRLGMKRPWNEWLIEWC